MRNKQDITAIITDKKGRILSLGRNSYIKSHPLMLKHGQDQNKIHLHAEVAAIVKCKNLNKAYKIQVFRFNKEGKPVIAKPCPICQSAIKATNIKVIEHT